MAEQAKQPRQHEVNVRDDRSEANKKPLRVSVVITENGITVLVGDREIEDHKQNGHG